MPNMTEEELAQLLVSRPDLSVDGEIKTPATPKPVAQKRASPEADFEREIVKLAHTLGYKVLVIRKARQRKGGVESWRTPFGATGKGFVDASFYHPVSGASFYVEFKSDTGWPSPEQSEWIEILRKCGNNVFVWRPRDIDWVIEVVTRLAGKR